MKDYIKELAKEAGFSIWENEEWGPGHGEICWSSNYDKELDALVCLLIEKLKSKIQEKIIEEPIHSVDEYGYNGGLTDSINILNEFLGDFHR